MASAKWRLFCLGLNVLKSECVFLSMVHTSLEKSWNLNLVLKSHWIWCWPGKMAFCLEKSLKISASHWKISIWRSWIFFVYCCLLTTIFKWVLVATRKLTTILHAFHMCFIHKLVIIKHMYDVAPIEAGYIWVHFITFFQDNSCLKRSLKGHGKVIKFHLHISVWTIFCKIIWIYPYLSHL